MMKKVIYFGYYLRHLDIKKLSQFLNYAHRVSGRTRLFLLFKSIRSVFVHNISILEYFQFRFFELPEQERRKWAGTGYMFEYQKKMNPTGVRNVLENKIAFNKHFKAYFGREFASLEEIIAKPDIAEKIISNPSGKVVLKNSMGQAGKEIRVVNSKDLSSSSLVGIMKAGRYDLSEEYIVQHPDLMKLSPSGLNTVRIITQEADGKIDIIAARLRITINSVVDNLAAGNAAAPVDIESGEVMGPAVFSDIWKEDITVHPVTGSNIQGFRVPFWNEILEMVKDAALMVPQNRSIGWDIALNSSGPLLVEGNHNWCKLLWQLPVKRGLKEDLLKYC